MLSGTSKWFQIYSATKFPLRKQEYTKISLILLWQALPSYPRGNSADQMKLRREKLGDRQPQITKAAVRSSQDLLTAQPSEGSLPFLHCEADAMSSNNNQTFWLWELWSSQLNLDSGKPLRHLERKQAPTETLKTQIWHSTWFWASQQCMTPTYPNTLENLSLKPINYRPEARRLRRVRAWNTRSTSWTFCNRHLAALLWHCMRGWFRAGEAAFNSAVPDQAHPNSEETFLTLPWQCTWPLGHLQPPDTHLQGNSSLLYKHNVESHK